MKDIPLPVWIVAAVVLAVVIYAVISSRKPKKKAYWEDDLGRR